MLCMHEQPVSYDVGAHGNADVENQSVKLGKQMLSSLGRCFFFFCMLAANVKSSIHFRILARLFW